MILQERRGREEEEEEEEEKRRVIEDRELSSVQRLCSVITNRGKEKDEEKRKYVQRDIHIYRGST